MSFKKPFRATPVILGDYARAEETRMQRLRAYRRFGLIALLTALVFPIGMVATNWNTLISRLPVYYPNCDAARAAGASSIKRDTPGYRSKLDEDNDGIACEPFGTH